MKKVLFMFFLLMFLCIPISIKAIATNSSYSVKINVFYKDNCKDCDKQKKWLEEYKKNNFINVEYIDIEDNKELYNKVKSALKVNKKDLPLVVVGSNYFIGFNDKIKSNLTDAIDSYLKNENYCELVTKLRNNDGVKDCLKNNQDIYKQSNSFPIFLKIVIVIIGIVLVIGIFKIINKKR